MVGKGNGKVGCVRRKLARSQAVLIVASDPSGKAV